MKYEITRANERGSADHGWLKANHYFSFGGYYDPLKLSFGKLRVINDDLIAPGMGFATHPHQDMEIITVPLSGAVKHKDSEGNEGVITAGEVQVMSAGSGIRHSEFNASHDEDLSLFQIWVEPNKLGVKPRYDQQKYELKLNEWTQLIRPISISDESGIGIYQETYMSMIKMGSNTVAKYSLKNPENGVYVLNVDSEIKLNELSLKKRDAIALEDVDEVLSLKATDETRVLVIEVSLK